MNNSTTSLPQSEQSGSAPTDVDAWLHAHNIEPPLYRSVLDDGSDAWMLHHCPMCRQAKPIIVDRNGNVTYQCKLCGTLPWAELTAKVNGAGPTSSVRAQSGSAPPTTGMVETPTAPSPPESKSAVVVTSFPLIHGGVIDGLKLFNANFPDLDFVADGILALGLTILVGRPKTGKSWLALQLALAVSRGKRLLDRFDISKPGSVLYCALEEPKRRTHARLHTMLNSRSDSALENIQFIYELPPSLPEAVVKLDKYLKSNPVRLVIIDTYLALLKTSDDQAHNNALRADYREIDQLRVLAERHNTAIVLVHHSRKMDAEFGLDAVAGTSGVTAACDSVWALKRQASGKYLLEITGREVEELDLKLRFDAEEPFGWKFEAEGAEVKIGPERGQILELLKEEPLAPVEIARRLGKNPSTIRNLVQRLARENLIVKGAKGKYTRFV